MNYNMKELVRIEDSQERNRPGIDKKSGCV